MLQTSTNAKETHPSTLGSAEVCPSSLWECPDNLSMDSWEPSAHIVEFPRRFVLFKGVRGNLLFYICMPIYENYIMCIIFWEYTYTTMH